jgi:hypothetical protein
VNSWQLDWEPDAEDELAQIWLGSAERAAVTKAPLACTFAIDVSRRKVNVTWVWTV